MKTKILIIGNQNNLLGSISTYLIDKFDVTLLDFQNTPTHFESKINAIPISSSLWMLLLFGLRGVNPKDYKLIIGCNLAPLLATRSGFRLDVFIPNGGDIRWCTSYRRLLNFRGLTLKKLLYLPLEFIATHMQRKGIARARILLNGLAGFDRHVLQEWDFSPVRDNLIKMFVPPNISKDVVERERKMPSVPICRQPKGLAIVNHCRHEWNTKTLNPSNKGQDVLIQGFAEYLAVSPQSTLHLVEYGRDVDASKDLIDKLGVVSNVVWYPKMHQSEVVDFIKKFDLVVAETRIACCYNGVHQEAIIAGKPLVAFRDPQYATHNYFILNLFERSMLNCLRDFELNREIHQTRAEYNKEMLIDEFYSTVRLIERSVRGSFDFIV